MTWCFSTPRDILTWCVCDRPKIMTCIITDGTNMCIQVCECFSNFLLLHSFAKDTCSALKDFQQNSHNSSLSSILPCLDPERSEKLMGQIGYTIHSFINQVYYILVKAIIINILAIYFYYVFDYCD